MAFLSSFYGMYMLGAYKIFGSTVGNIDDFTLTVAGSLSSLSNGLCQLTMCTLFDKYGFKRIYGCVLCL